MTPDELTSALRLWASSLRCAGAAVELLARHGYWLPEFAGDPARFGIRYADYGGYANDPGAAHVSRGGDPNAAYVEPVAVIRWDVLATQADQPVAAEGQGRAPETAQAVLLATASIGGGTPVDLQWAVSTLGSPSLRLVLDAMARAGALVPLSDTPAPAPLDTWAVVHLHGYTQRVGHLSHSEQVPGFLELRTQDGATRLINPKAVFEIEVPTERDAGGPRENGGGEDGDCPPF